MRQITVSQPEQGGSLTPFVRSMVELADPDRQLGDVDHVLCERVVMLLCYVAWRGYGRVRVSSGRRTLREQEAIYGRGRSRADLERAGVDPGMADPDRPIVSWVHPAASRHVSGKAVDLDVSAYGVGCYGALQDGARMVGLRWGGEWRVQDAGHFEV